MSLKVELHTHTKKSYDVLTPYEEIIQSCIKSGVDVLAVTDHNEIAGALRLHKMAPLKVKVIVGEEILTVDGEIIGLFLKEFIPPGLPIEETVERIKQQGGIVYLPHPFDKTTRKTSIRREKIMKIAEHIDIIEVFNGRTIFSGDNKRARALARELNKPFAVGSDAHTKYEFGRTFLEMPEFSTPEEFVRSVEKAKIKTSHVIPWVFLFTKWARFKKGRLAQKINPLANPLTKCNLCGGKDFAVIYKKRGRIRKKYLITDDSYGSHHQLIKCLDCKLIFAYPRDQKKRVVEKYISFQDPSYERERNERGQNQKRILEKINSFVGKRGSLLEVGCATGVFLGHARADGWSVLGIEPSKWAAHIAQEKHKLPVLQGTLDEVDMNEKRFDVVVCIDVIEHVTDPKGFLAQIYKVLKPNGLLCLVTPDRGSLVAKFLGEKWWHIRPDHLYYFSKQTISSLLISTGFRALSVHRYPWKFTLHYWFSRTRTIAPFVYRLYDRLSKTSLGKVMLGSSISINFRDSLEIYSIKRNSRLKAYDSYYHRGW